MRKLKTVFVSGNFNILHPGHVRLLRFAKESGDRLIVGVKSDGIAGEQAHVPEHLRLEGLQCSSFVDEAFIFSDRIEDLLLKIKPDIVVKGREHEFSFNPEASIIEQYGGSLVFSSGEAIFSSYDLIKKEHYELDVRSITLPNEYLIRHNIKKERLSSLLDRFANLRVCVVGDLIVDEYITCQPLGMSQEDPVIVVTPIESFKFIGGAGIVAAHAAGLGAKTMFFSVTGNDSNRSFAIETLKSSLVNADLLIDENRPTTLKQRYRSLGKSLFRVSHLHQGDISRELQKVIIDKVANSITTFDLIVFSDFNYGCLPQPLVDSIVSLAKKNNVMLVADSQSSSQIGDISRFKNMHLITPTEREARLSTRNREDGLVVLAEELRGQANADNVLLKMGNEGVLIHAGQLEKGAWLTDRINALNSMPKDVAGAGDSMLIVSAMSLASGGTIWEAACLGSIAAAVQVGRVGNTPLVLNELMRELS